MEGKFKVGDKVRFIGSTHIWELEKLLEVRDKLEIADFDDSNGKIAIMYREKTAKWYRWWVDPAEIELIEFTKANLQPGDVVTLRNGARLILDDDGDEFIDLDNIPNAIGSTNRLNDDLTYYSELEYTRANDIMKVERPTYHTVYEREETGPRKMTVAEISKELGYDVEIVKG